MDNSKEIRSINRPPISDGTNYDYWKARMMTFLKSMDIKTWSDIIKGLQHHVIIVRVNITLPSYNTAHFQVSPYQFIFLDFIHII